MPRERDPTLAGGPRAGKDDPVGVSRYGVEGYGDEPAERTWTYDERFFAERDGEDIAFDTVFRIVEKVDGPPQERGFYVSATIYEETEPVDTIFEAAGPYRSHREAFDVGHSGVRQWAERLKAGYGEAPVVSRLGAQPVRAVRHWDAEPILLFSGTNNISFLERTSTPLFISRNAFFRDGKEIRRKPRALGKWALDSGGFTEVVFKGGWRTTARDYADFVRRARDEVGGLLWAAPQDWMCEPPALLKTGKTVAEHQRLTVENFIELRSIAPDLPIIPVLQGFWGPFSEATNMGGERWVWDYLELQPDGPGATYADHIQMYLDAGVDLREYPLVGVGSVCRRAENFAFYLQLQQQLAPLQQAGVRFHGFGFKTTSLAATLHNDFLASIDSMAWSFSARNRDGVLVPWHSQPGVGRRKGHTKCNNCLEGMLLWRARVLTQFPHLYAPTPMGAPLVLEDLGKHEQVMSPRFLELLDRYRHSTLSPDEQAASDDYPLESGSVRHETAAEELRAVVAALPKGVYFPPLPVVG